MTNRVDAWVAVRGWALLGALAFLTSALLLRPVSIPIPEVLPVLTFGLAGISLLWLYFAPGSHVARYVAVACTVGATMGRALSLMLLGTNDVGTRSAGALIWLFVGVCCWLLGTLTSSLPRSG